MRILIILGLLSLPALAQGTGSGRWFVVGALGTLLVGLAVYRSQSAAVRRGDRDAPAQELNVFTGPALPDGSLVWHTLPAYRHPHPMNMPRPATLSPCW